MRLTDEIMILKARQSRKRLKWDCREGRDSATRPLMPSPDVKPEPLLTLKGHMDMVMSVAVFAGDRRALSASFNGTLKVWDLENGRQIQSLEGHGDAVLSAVVFGGDRRALSTGVGGMLKVVDLEGGRLIDGLEDHDGSVLSAVVFAGDRRALSASADGSLKVWDLESGRLLQRLEGHHGEVFSAMVFAGDRRALSTSWDGTLKVWDLESGRVLQSLEGHAGPVFHAVVYAGDRRALSASGDGTLKVWNLESGRLLQSLEGHAGAVYSAVVYAKDRRALSASADGSLKVWDLESGRLLHSINAHKSDIRGVAVFAGGRRAISASDDHTLKVWDLEALTGALPPERSSVYINAKVALVGDSGVGKSGLRLVLEGKPFEPTDSTHGRYVTTFEKEEVPHGSDQMLHRETLLWDLAGQPNYRLINQLHLRDVAVALVLFDSKRGTDPFAGVRHWNRALEVAGRSRGSGAPRLRKFLVAARTDVGTVGVGRERIEALIAELGFEKEWFETSAKEGRQIAELAAAIRAGIPWSEMPQVVSTELFQQIKNFLVEMKKSGRVLAEEAELLAVFNAGKGKGDGEGAQAATIEQFRTCADRLRDAGLIRRLPFGDLLLLQPEVLDNYASALINAARQEPDGFGCIRLERVQAGDFPVPPGERLASKAQERQLLSEMVRDLLDHEIAWREETQEGTLLVFPSEFTRENPSLPEPEGKAVVGEFAGPVVSIYTTLAVRLAQSGTFVHRELWRNAVTYRPARGEGECGFFLQEVDEGHGRLTIFHTHATPALTRELFEAFVEDHLRTHALPETVKWRRVVACPECHRALADGVVERRRARGLDYATCSECDTRIPFDPAGAASASPDTAAQVREMGRAADATKEKAEASAIIEGKRATNDFDVFLCHNSRSKPAVKKIAEELIKHGILPWLDEWELRPGFPWQDALERQIKTIKAAAVFVGPDGMGPWQDQELKAFIRKFVAKQAPVIPVLLEGLMEVPELPTFFEGFHAVDFRKPSPDPMEQLRWGITGDRGGRGATERG